MKYFYSALSFIGTAAILIPTVTIAVGILV